MPIYIDGVPYRNLEDQVKYLTEGYNDLSVITTYMPVDVSSTNPLASRAYVDQSVTTVAAHYLTSDALGNNFPTKAALLAGPYFYGIDLHLPDENDYAFVNADEDHNGLPSRYVYIMNAWMYQYSLQASGGVVDLTSAQTITGVKTFTNGLQLKGSSKIDGGNGYYIGFYADGVSYALTNSGFTSIDNRDLGNNGSKWKDLYLSGNGFMSECRCYYVGVSGVDLYMKGSSFNPDTIGTKDLGNSTFTWKDLYLSGNIIGAYKEANTVAYSAGNYVASFNMDAITVDKIKYLEITIESINENYVVMFPVSAVNMSTYTAQHAFKTNGYPIDTIIVNYSGGSLNVLIPYGTSGLTVHVFAKMI